VFLAVATSQSGPFSVPAGNDTWTESNVVFSFRVLASWKGARSDTISLSTGAGGGDCGYEFILGGVYLVYGNRDRMGGLHTGLCNRTREISRAHEDSLALGPPMHDRLAGRLWSAFGPPATCPVHAGVPIQVSRQGIAFDLTPDSRRAYPAWVSREAPCAAMPLAPVGWKGGKVNDAYVCPLCREAALAWVGTSREGSTAPEDFGDMVATKGTPAHAEKEYRSRFPRGNFAFQYDDGRQNYDSIESRFQREYGAVHDTSMKFSLSDVELDRLYEAAVRARLFDLNAPHPSYPKARAGALVRADRRQLLFVRCGIEIRQFAWYASRAPAAPAAGSEWRRLSDFYRQVQEVIAGRAETQALTPIPTALDDPLRDVRGH
jgi:hypothetical protein